MVEDVRVMLDQGNTTALGTLYVYRVADDLYEVDWELTTISPVVVEALALAAYQTGQMLPCHLVLPKARRGRNVTTPKARPTLDERVTYGQLRLPL